MASKTYTVLTGYSNTYYVRLIMSSIPNTAGNYSDVSYTFQYGSDSPTAGYQYRYKNRVYFAINGTVIVDTSNIGAIMFNGAGAHTLVSGSIRVTHNADGTKSIPVHGIFSQLQDTTYSGTIQENFVLDAIPKATAPTLSKASVKAGESVNITMNRASTAFKHTLTYSIGSASGTIAEKVDTSASWTVPKNLANQFPNSASGTVTVTCKTYNGSSLIGSKNVTLTVNVSDDMKPTCSVSVSEAETLPAGITGYVKSKSKLNITSTGAGSYGSTIKSYSISANGATYNSSSATTDFLTTAGKNVITLTVTDSRGRTATDSLEITVKDYALPNISSLSVYRCTAADDPTELSTGDFVAISFAGEISSLEGENAKTCTVFYKPVSASEWSSSNVTLGSHAFDTVAIVPATADSSFNVHVQIADSFSQSNYYQDIGTGKTLINIHASNRGLAIGRVAEEENLVDIDMDERIRGNLTVDADTQLNGLKAGKSELGQTFINSGSYLAAILQRDSDLYSPLLAFDNTAGRIASIGFGGATKHVSIFNADASNYATILDSLNYNNYAAQKVVYGGSATNGYIRFPDANVQIAWKQVTWAGAISSAWGNMYESTAIINIGNWAASFNGSYYPNVTYGVRCDSQSAGTILQMYQAPNAQSAGGVYLCRPNAVTTSYTYRVMAIGVGYYT